MKLRKLKIFLVKTHNFSSKFSLLAPIKKWLLFILCLNRQIYFLMNYAYSSCMICFVKQRWHHTINYDNILFFFIYLLVIFFIVFWRIENKLEYRQVFLTVVQFKRRYYKSSDLQHIDIFGLVWHVMILVQFHQIILSRPCSFSLKFHV